MPNTEPRADPSAPLPGGAPDYDSPTALKALLDAEGFAMSKRFGQNFLVDRGARARILAALGARAGEEAWEIGPGLGAMTAMALEGGIAITAFEIDHGFCRALRAIFGGRGDFRLVEGDFLRTWRDAVAERGPPALIFGNLPYSAANAIVAAIIEGGILPRRTVFTVQKEAAMRMAAKPGSKDYSAFTVLCSSACKVRIAFDLGAGSFWPPPNVTSSVVVLEPRPDPVQAGARAEFSTFVRTAFSSRRKTLRNNLKANPRAWGEARGVGLAAAPEGPAAAPEGGATAPEDPIAAAIESAGHRPDVRAEALSPESLAAVFEALRSDGRR